MNITQFTTAQAQNRLQADGLETLGLTGLLLAPRWSTTAAPTFDPVALSYLLQATGPVTVPTGSGEPVTVASDNAVDVLLHEAYQRAKALQSI